MISALRHHRDFEGTFEGAAAAAVWLHWIADAEQLSDKLKFALELCLEELFTNVVRHGTPGRDAEGNRAPLTVDVAVKVGEDAVDLVVSDNGAKFDVSHAPSQPVHQPLEEVAPGGLGIQLIRSFSDDVRYEPLPAGNRVIVKFLRPEAATSKAEA